MIRLLVKRLARAA